MIRRPAVRQRRRVYYELTDDLNAAEIRREQEFQEALARWKAEAKNRVYLLDMDKPKEEPTVKKFSPLHRLILRRHGMSDADIDAAEAAGLDWMALITMILEVGLPILLEWLKSLKKGEESDAA